MKPFWLAKPSASVWGANPPTSAPAEELKPKQRRMPIRRNTTQMLSAGEMPRAASVPTTMGSRQRVGDIGSVRARGRPAFLITDNPEQGPSEQDPYTLLIQDLDTLASELSDFQSQK